MSGKRRELMLRERIMTMIAVQIWFPSGFRDDDLTIHFTRVPSVGERLSLFANDKRLDFEIINVIHECFISSITSKYITEMGNHGVAIEVRPINRAYILS